MSTNFVPKCSMAVLLCVVVVLVTACGSQSSSSGAKQPKVTLVLGITGLPFSQTIQAGAQAGVDETGAKLTVVGPPNVDPSAEAKMLDDAITLHPDGVVPQLEPPDYFTRQLKHASTAKVPIAGFGLLPPDTTAISTFVNNDFREMGRVIANAVADRLIQKLGPDPHGSVVTSICVEGAQSHLLTAAGEKEGFAKRLPNVQVIGPLLTDPEPTKDFAAWGAIMRAHPTALAYLGRCDQDGPNLTKLKTQMHGTFEITGWDADPVTLQATKSGVMLASMPQSFYLEGYILTRLIAEAAKSGKPLPHGWYNPGSQLITAANIDAVMTREASPTNARAYYRQQIDQFFSDPQKHLRPLSEFPNA